MGSVKTLFYDLICIWNVQYLSLCYKCKPIIHPVILHATNYLEINTEINNFKSFKIHNCSCIKLKNDQRLKTKSDYNMRVLNSQERVS